MDIMELVECISTDRAPVVQRLCWTCSRLFSVRNGSDDTRVCPACKRRKEQGKDAITTQHVIGSKGITYPLAKMPASETIIPEDRKKIRMNDNGPNNPTVNPILLYAANQVVITRMDWYFLRSMVPARVDLGVSVADFNRCVVIKNGKTIKLTNQELRMLALLCADLGAVVPLMILDTQVSRIAGRSIDTFKSMLGRKIGINIKRVHGIGFYLEPTTAHRRAMKRKAA